MKDFHIVRGLEVPSSWIEIALANFVKESHLDPSIDQVGFFNMTLDVVSKAILFNHPDKEFWMAYDDKGVISYSLCCYVIDIDNTLCYQISQAWVRKDYQRQPIVKQWFQQMRQHAIDTFCKHLIIPSSRGEKAYKRYISKNLNQYSVVLKEDL